MRQIPAALLVLAAAILGQTAGLRPYDPLAVIIGLAGLLLGGWGLLCLFGPSLRSAGIQLRRADRPAPPRGRFELFERYVEDEATDRRPAHPGRDISECGRPEAGLAADVRTQLAVTAQVEGRPQSEIIAEALRQYLPRCQQQPSAARPRDTGGRRRKKAA
jgi:hypothetical protein